MGMSYRKLFNILEIKNISKTDLQKNIKISSSTLAKLSKNEPVSLQVIADICEFLGCQPGDIIEVYNDKKKNTLLSVLKEERKVGLKGGIYHRTQIKLAYNSNHIEGSKLSEDQTRCIFETNTIGLEYENETANIDDIMETINHFACFNYIIDNAENELTDVFIKNLHKILKLNTSDSRLEWFAVGDYKKKQNVVGNKRTTHPSKVSYEITKLLLDYNNIEKVTIEDIIEFHYRFERIHPFQDGNGRVGRLIMFKECLKYNIVPFIIDESHKWFYYRGLNEFEQERGYLIDTCLSEQDEYKKILDYFEIEYE